MNTRAPRELRWFLVGLVCVYVLKQVLTAVVFPPFTGHDEVAHFEYVRVLATERRVPTLYSHLLPPDLYGYRQFSIQWDEETFAPLYTAVHPPLYYALMVPVYRAVKDMRPEAIQYALRFAAIPFGLVVVLLAWRLTDAVFPRDMFLGVTIPTIVAFQPQVSYEAAMVNNDIVAIALYSWLLYLLVLVVRDGVSTGRALLVGAAAGLALLAKGTAVMGLVLIPAAFWLGRSGTGVAGLLRPLAGAFAVAAAIAGPWWWFMVRTYGDPMAVAALAEMQPGLTQQGATFLDVLFSGAFLAERWAETWGEFGWKRIPVSGGLTAALGLAVIVAALGLATYALPGQRRDTLEPWQTRAILLLAGACALSYAGIVQFGTTFVLSQARYYFPIVNAAALCVMLGLRAWIPGRWRLAAQGTVVFAAIAVNITIYTAHVVPYWHFRS